MSDYQVRIDDSLMVADGHDESADNIEAAARRVPQSLDGGEATGLLLELMRRPVLDAAALVRVERSSAARMRLTSDNYRGMEVGAVAAFRKLGDALDG